MHCGYLGWNLHAASSASLLLHWKSPSMLQMCHSLSLPCVCAHCQQGADSPTKANVRLKTGGALFQILTVPIENKFQETKQIHFRILIVC